MENPPARGGRGGPPAVLPKRDQVLSEGQAVVLGDFKLMPVAIPGHTPGSMGFIFPVKDKGKKHMAAMYGGTILTPGFVSDEGLQMYPKSVAHFEEETKRAKVEVELQNHPLMDPIQPKLDALKTRKPGEANPFVVGRGEYQKFLQVMGACTDVNIARAQGHLMAKLPVAAVVAAMSVLVVWNAWGQGGRGPAQPRTAKAAALFDITGYWVAVVTEDWRYRMVTPLKGDYGGVTLNPGGRKIADAWDPFER